MTEIEQLLKEKGEEWSAYHGEYEGPECLPDGQPSLVRKLDSELSEEEKVLHWFKDEIVNIFNSSNNVMRLTEGDIWKELQKNVFEVNDVEFTLEYQDMLTRILETSF